MKKSPLFFLVLTLISSLAITSDKLFAQTASTVNYTIATVNFESINGDILIENLVNTRHEFNKNLTKYNKVNTTNLPKAEYIFNKENLTTFTFEGLDFLMKDNQVLGIKGLNLSNEVLAQITDKLIFLDRVQFYYAEKLNNEYLDPSDDVQTIKYTDRQFFLSLKILSTTLKDIAAFTKTANPSLAVAINVSKMREPNIDKSVGVQNIQSLVQLSK
ncbi:hypothetical protein EZ449_11115 [Pedobacter frigidisoli]|uniref:Uncharacterized protein n=1 Tax=Pedobacter frigidisoli TaxID=2530455 RepID=A0A4R0P789_9SPHI|nr:hypothetical protein [Pedobacter frigidisoli]TCD10359.1 hypothetical protein EZ449_11115 [Pedobacter frigidisoli]